MNDNLYKRGLQTMLEVTDFSHLGEKYEGKVRDCYVKNGIRTMITTDRLSAFDKHITTIPYKGQILNAASNWWFEQTKHIAPNHLIDIPDPAVVVAEDCEPLKCEFVMRGYITGTTSTSMWMHYQNGSRMFCGHRLPNGLRKNQKLDKPILTPSTKAPKGKNDKSLSRKDIIASGAISARDFDEAAEYAEALYNHAVETSERNGLIFVDTKYEFGKNSKGQIVLMDEINTPEGSRFWYKDDYQSHFDNDANPPSFDKEFVRLWLTSKGYNGVGEPPNVPDDIKILASKKYAQAFKQITGSELIFNTEDPMSRMAETLRNL